ncbi:hypothetical protein DYB32_008369 [Aphanomyces invadans]|uniref:START domain-containing protein n=1 Tax=Aphanomyces invadans TaxID=157072 RepID=A0A418ALJ9_9STRA|nr:hypothetical protein DYB32_008369 [Aphanomyces invadans]
MDAATDKKARRRVYFKTMRQMYRNEEKQEKEYLIKKIQELENDLATLVLLQKTGSDESKTALPWKDIAQELNEGVKVASSGLKMLKTQVETIATQMYHNTDRIFQQYGFPALDSPETIDWDTESINIDGGDYTVYRRQAKMAESLEDAIAFVDSTLLSIQASYAEQHAISQTVVEIEGNTKQFAIVTPRQEFVNLLCGEFSTPSRCVFVLQQILDDEACPHRGFRQRNRMFWYEGSIKGVLTSGCAQA